MPALGSSGGFQLPCTGPEPGWWLGLSRDPQVLGLASGACGRLGKGQTCPPGVHKEEAQLPAPSCHGSGCAYIPFHQLFQA